MPMEFSRVSPKRKMGLAVVLDAHNGVDCPTHAVPSVREDIHSVAEDLRARERAKGIEFIGAYCVSTGFRRSHHPEVLDRVEVWCDETGALGAVWTDLPANFSEHVGEAFSIEAAQRYLRTLRGESLAEAVRYIDNAPVETQTPLRTHLENDEWWTGLGRD